VSELPPLSLYVHLPWCVRKCPYCDFNSHSAGNDPPFRRYLDALVRDISNESVRAENRVVESV
jgi:coproporphyrinogen III oxidase-like Fe-S oxidoreductase